MNKIITIVFTLCLLSSLFSQGVKISETPGSPNSSSMLDIESTNKGLLPPRMTSAQRDAIISPAAGLRIFNTTTNCENFYNGSAWFEICGICIPGAPSTPGSITGTASPCASATGITYSVPTVTGATSYTWTLPTGWIITSGQGTNSIVVTSGNAGQNGNVSVVAVNACGTSAASTLPVSIVNPNATFTFTPAIATTNAAVTFNASIPGLTYNWAFQSASPASATGQSANATWSSAGTYQVILTVTNGNGCTASSTQSITVSNCPPPFQSSITFNYNGSMQSWVVPNCVTQVQLTCYGAQGGGSYCCSGTQEDGGLGGQATGILSVTPGQTLYLYVGQKPGISNGNTTGGWNGGGGSGQYGGAGGGATDVRVGGQALNNRVIVAGGGGGGNCGCPDHGQGGTGGGSTGGTGLSFQSWTPGQGGTQVSGFSQGSGQDGFAIYHQAGGGGGWYGGYSAYAAGAGGGSGYIGGVTSGSTQNGINSGNGYIVINY